MQAPPTRRDDPRLENWYHTIELGDGLVTNGHFDHRPVVDRYGIPESLEGRSALDVGTGDGFFAFELERRGADRVVAVDVPRLGACDWLPRIRAKRGPALDLDESWPNHFRIAHAMRRSRVEYRFCSVYDLSPQTVGIFDVVFCGSLLLHLQNPLQALHRIRSVTREMAVIETAVYPELEESFGHHPVVWFGSAREEPEPGEDNSFWLFTTRALERMLVYADFARIEPQGLFELGPTGPLVTSVVANTKPFA